MKKTIFIAFLIASIGTTNAQVSLGYSYILSSQKSNVSPSNTLFGGDGHSLRLGIAWDPFVKRKATTQTEKLAPRLGLAFGLSYQFGKTSQDDLTSFAKSQTAPLGYKIGQSSTDWKQFVVMGGPILRLGKRNNGLLPFEISAEVGAAFKLVPRQITIDKTDGQAVTSRVFDKTDNNSIFAWQMKASLPVFGLGKRINCCLEAGFGFNGGTVGISFKDAPRKVKGGFYLPNSQ